jgi:PIN domain nuclease of toxin-antitoxin system
LAIDFSDAKLVSSLEHHHRDPFDRMLIAQAKIGDLAIVSNEAIFDKYGVKRIW